MPHRQQARARDVLNTLQLCKAASGRPIAQRLETLLSVGKFLISVENDGDVQRSLQDDLLSATTALLVDVEFCSYSKVDILGWRDAPQQCELSLIYVACLMDMHVRAFRCLRDLHFQHRARDAHIDRRKDRWLDSILSDHSRLWSIMFSLRNVLFGDSAVGEMLDSVLDSEATGRFALNLIGLGEAYLQIMADVDPSPPGNNYEVVMLLAFIWLSAKPLSIRDWAMSTIYSHTGPPTSFKSPMHAGFYSMLMVETTTPQHVLMCILRDLREELHVDNQLKFFTGLLLSCREGSRFDPLTLDMPLDRQVFLSALAASRRQLCRGQEHKSFGILSFVASHVRNVSMAICRKIYIVNLPEPTVHAMIALLMPALVRAFHAQSEELLVDLVPIARCCTDSLTEILVRRCAGGSPSTLSPELFCMRRLSSRLFKEVTPLVRASRSSLLLDLNFTLVVWVPLGQVISGLSNDERADPYKHWSFPPLKRCGWDQCLCSVHKPAHAMRVCAGCWQVAYCGARCQEKDWSMGGHNKACGESKRSDS